MKSFENGPGVRLSDACFIHRRNPVAECQFEEPPLVRIGQWIARILRWMGR